MNLGQLRVLYQRPGPWASVYLDAEERLPEGVGAVLRYRVAPAGGSDASR